MTSILSFLGFRTAPASGDSAAIEAIAATLDRLEPSRARYMAAFAYILSRLAAADHVVTADETRAMEAIVREMGGLPPEQAVLVVEMATRQQALFGATDDFLVTRELQRHATYGTRLQLVECLFAVAAADARVGIDEGDEIGRIARELRIEQADISRLRHRYMTPRPGAS